MIEFTYVFKGWNAQVGNQHFVFPALISGKCIPFELMITRLNALGRREWDFDVIEYSILEDSTEQSEWESYWLNKFVEREGKLPVYNKIGGKRKQI